MRVCDRKHYPEIPSIFSYCSGLSDIQTKGGERGKGNRSRACGLSESPVPSLETQQKVVDILDRFDALTTSLTDGLPAEIEARNQQYEYYRDRLLDFPRKAIGTE